MTSRKLRGALAAGALLCLAGLPIPTVAGRWKLAEQVYGSGKANLATAEAPVRLEFFVSGGRLTGRIWAGNDAASALPWPALLTEHGPRPLEIRQMVIAPENDRVRAVCRTRAASPDEEVYEIIEEYRLSEAGAVLLGTVTIRAVGPDGSGGSYELHRRFERER
ncbi:MAG TPA: hypothetical protein VGR67_13355 [Candidatus Polarisedimenticolia bacterium]|jgi:hypothetical protein|nr:hypothetical protein [Candidatus Polarisedimenticolia bacterium]